MKKKAFKFRKELEERFDWKHHKYCFRSCCGYISQLFNLQCLDGQGILYQGYFELMPPYNTRFAELYQEPCLGMSYDHIFICYDNIGLDLSRDQFYIGNEEQHRIYVEDVEETLAVIQNVKSFKFAWAITCDKLEQFIANQVQYNKETIYDTI